MSNIKQIQNKYKNKDYFPKLSDRIKLLTNLEPRNNIHAQNGYNYYILIDMRGDIVDVYLTTHPNSLLEVLKSSSLYNRRKDRFKGKFRNNHNKLIHNAYDSYGIDYGKFIAPNWFLGGFWLPKDEINSLIEQDYLNQIILKNFFGKTREWVLQGATNLKDI